MTTSAFPTETPTLDLITEGLAWLVLGLVPLLINVYNVDAYRTIQATYSTTLILVMMATWIVSITLTGQWHRLKNLPFFWPLAGFAAWSLFTFVFTSTSIPTSGASWLNLLLYCGFFYLLADFGVCKPGFLWRLSIPIGFAFAFNNLTGLLQHKAFRFLDTSGGAFTGLYGLWPFKSSAAANYFAGLQAPSRLLSAAGTLGNQNVLGGYLAATIPLFAVLPVICFLNRKQLIGYLMGFGKVDSTRPNFYLATVSLMLALCLPGILDFLWQSPLIPVSLGGLLGRMLIGLVLSGFMLTVVLLASRMPILEQKQPLTLSEGKAAFVVDFLTGVLIANFLASIASLLATDTRGAWIGVGGSAFLALVMVPAFFREQLMRVSRQSWIKICLTCLIGLVAIGGLAYSAGVTPLMLRTKVANTWTIKQRLVAWQVAEDMANERPVMGLGLATYKINYFRYLAKHFNGKPVPIYMHQRYVQAHNDFIQLAGEEGWVGLAIALAIMAAFCIAAPRYVWRHRPPAADGMLLMAAVLGTFGMAVFGISNFPFHIASSSTTWTALAAIEGCFLLGERRQAATNQQAPAPKAGLPLEARWALSGTIAVLAGSLVIFTFLPYKADTYTKEGMELYRAQRVPEAQNLLKEAIALDPERGDARLVLGITMAMMNDLSGAADQLIKSQGSYDDVTLHYYLGRIYEAEKKPSEALLEYHKALSYFPEGSDVRKAVNERLTFLNGSHSAVVGSKI